MNLEKSLELLELSKVRVGNMNYGDLVTNVCAGEQNPRRHSFFCSFVKRTRTNKYDREHSEYFAKCTDRKGSFWQADINVIYAGHLQQSECEALFAPVWEAKYGK
jgi:hypothetical protein